MYKKSIYAECEFQAQVWKNPKFEPFRTQVRLPKLNYEPK